MLLSLCNINYVHLVYSWECLVDNNNSYDDNDDDYDEEEHESRSHLCFILINSDMHFAYELHSTNYSDAFKNWWEE